MTQNDRVLRHLREVGTLTGAQAMRDYGIAHLASRISELRASGKNIIGKTGHLTNRVDLIDLPNCKQKFTNVEGVIG